MAGRKLIPMEIKKLKGTYRKDRDRKPPPASKGKPHPPKWLNTDAKQKFNLMVKRLDGLGMASNTYTEGIALLASRLGEVERLTEVLDQEGVILGAKEHPAVKMREKAMNHAHRLLVEFGLTASSIQKVGRPKQQKKKNVFDRF
jgi:P27 family predicted phage terminase small subunit